MTEPELAGVLIIDKAKGHPSHDIVASLRRILHMRKIGHCGTLDPLATGVLVVCLGRYTRLNRWLSGADKSDEAKVELGATSPPGDAQGQITPLEGADQPDLALVTDVTHATDYPAVDRRLHGDLSLGKGPTLTHGGPNHAGVVAQLEKVASKHAIPLQHESTSNSTGTDTDVIFWTRGGIPCALISIPNRYMHSPVELVHLDDVERASSLMAGFARSLKKGQQFGGDL